MENFEEICELNTKYQKFDPKDSTNITYNTTIKGILVGDSGVGKSSLLKRYTEGEFSCGYSSTIGVDFRTVSFNHDKNKFTKLQIWDTAGQERFRTITTSYYRGTNCIILVFDVTNVESFLHIKNWCSEANQYKQPDVPFYLIGNKYDEPEHTHQVSNKLIEDLAKEVGCQFIKTSAKSNKNINEAFDIIVDEAIRHKKMSMTTGNPNRIGVMLNSDKKVEDKRKCPC